MDLKKIAEIFETLLDAALKAGLFHDNKSASVTIAAKQSLDQHAAAAAAAPVTAGAVKNDLSYVPEK